MTAIILAAGISSRLRPLTDSLPKSLLCVGGRPLLQRTLEGLREARIHRCIIVTGFCEERIRDLVTTLDLDMDISFVSNSRFASTNNNYSLWLAKPEVADQEIMILDADILFDPLILVELMRATHKDALVMKREHHLGKEEIKLLLDPSGYVRQIGKEPDPGEAAGESIGIEKFSAETAGKLFAALDKRKERNEFYESSFQEIINDGARIYALECGEHPCMEIDTLEDLEAAERLARTVLI